MKLHDNGLGFSPITLVLHWIIAIAVLVMISIGLVAARLNDSPDKQTILQLYSGIGMCVFVISVYRLWARLSFYHPLPIGIINPIVLIVSRSVAIALVLGTVILPLLGWLSVAATGTTLKPFGLLALPVMKEPSPALAAAAHFLHRVGAYAFGLGLALHIFGAVRHHFVDKDDTVRRMFGKSVEL